MTVKRFDAVKRRMGHIATNMTTSLPFLIIAGKYRFSLFMWMTQFNIMIHVLGEKSNSYWSLLYDGARMRDGHLGRFNLLIVNFFGGNIALFFLIF